MWHTICLYEPSFSSYNREVVSLLIEGIIRSRTVNLKEVVCNLPCKASSDSLYRRFQRFFMKEMDLCGIGIFILETFLKTALRSLPRPLNLYLSIDRHEWHFGSKVNNLLVLHLYEPITGIDFPIQVIDLDRRGNSSTIERGDIIESVLPVLRPFISEGKVKATVLGDREFFSHYWRDQLVIHGFDYKIRVKKDFKIYNNINVGTVFSGLSIGENKDFTLEQGRLVITRLTEESDRRDSCLAVLTNDTESSIEEVFADYSVRWKIERSFFNLESNGWNLKRTHLKAHKRIEMMFNILLLCYYCAVLFGYMLAQLRKVPFKKHGYRAITLFLSGRRIIAEMYIRDMIPFFKKICSRVEFLIRKAMSIEFVYSMECDESQGVV